MRCVRFTGCIYYDVAVQDFTHYANKSPLTTDNTLPMIALNIKNLLSKIC